MFSCEIYKIYKSKIFCYSGCFGGLTCVFKGAWDKNQCDCLQYIPDLAEEGICCRENLEPAAVGVL